MRRAPLPAPRTLPVQEATATWTVVTGGNDVFWRAEAPAAAVGGKVLKLKEKQYARAVSYPNSDTGFPWTASLNTPDGVKTARTKADWNKLCSSRAEFDRLTVEFPAHEGSAAVFTRPCMARATLALHMAEQGIRVVAETDDNYFADHNQNLFMRQQGFKEQSRDHHAKAMAAFPVSVYSTRWLRDRYAKEFRGRFGKKLLPEMHVCRNHVPRDQWPERVEQDGKLRVGFMGSPSHVWDIFFAYGAFAAAQDFGCETVMIGYNPGDPDPGMPDTVEADGKIYEIRSKKSRHDRDKWASRIDRHIPWIDPSAYHRAALPLDIGLCPLRSDDFCDSKSDVKAIEYTISGAAVVAMNTPVYNTAGWKDGVNCLLAGSWREMAEQTVRLIRDPKLRFELVTAAQEMVWNERNEDVLREEWSTALEI